MAGSIPTVRYHKGLNSSSHRLLSRHQLKLTFCRTRHQVVDRYLFRISSLRALPAIPLLPKISPNAGRGFHLSAAKAVSFEGLSGRLFECERRQRLKRCSPSVCATKWDGKRNPRNIGQTQPRALLISVSLSSPKDSLKTELFSRISIWDIIT